METAKEKDGIRITFWYGDLSEKSGYKREQWFPRDKMMDIINCLLEKKLYIMLLPHGDEDGNIYLAIDTCPFRTR